MNTPRDASLNLNVRGLGQSATIAINQRSKQLLREGKQVYRLGLGQSPFPVPRPVVDALRANAHEKDYLPAEGLRQLREAIAGCQWRSDCIERHPDHVIIGPGSKELMFLLQLVYYGELMVPTPCWVSYVPQATILGRKVSLIHTRAADKWKLTADLLERHCAGQRDEHRPRILVMNYPGNPTGLTHDVDELQALSEVAARYRIVLLSDEIYGQLHHRGQHVSIARFYPEGTIVSSGLSKWCGAGGWRLGMFSFPPDLNWLAEAMAAVASETYTSVCAPVQYAAVRAFKGGQSIERYLWHVRRILAALGNRCADMLRQADIHVEAPEGGFYLWPDFSPHARVLAKRGIVDSAESCERLLSETGVALLPGAVFQRPPGELTARLAYVDFDGAKALVASENHGLNQPLPEDFVDFWCYGVLEAVKHMISWVKGRSKARNSGKENLTRKVNAIIETT
jgi:aspartate aminotransferase